MSRHAGRPATLTLRDLVEFAELRRPRMVRRARMIVAISWLVYACLTTAILLLMFFFYGAGDYGDCFAPGRCTKTLPPDPLMIVIGLGAAGLAFAVGSLVAWLPSHRVFAISGLSALGITCGWLAVGISPTGDPGAVMVCFLSAPPLIGSWVGWRNSVVRSRGQDSGFRADPGRP